MKTALITGITGQDGSYLAELLLRLGYRVHGLIRRSSSFNTSRIEHLRVINGELNSNLTLHYGDLADTSRLSALVAELRPDELYHLGAQSHVRVSFDEPENTGNITGLSSARVLETIRTLSPSTKVYQASSSEMFGATAPPQNEDSAFYPRSPYGAAKVYSYWMARNFREAYGMFVSNGILFNHESPRRGETFVTRKITSSAARISLGLQDRLFLGNVDAKRDWGYAPEYAFGMFLMLQQPKPDDFVLASGTSASVLEFLDWSFSAVGLDWKKFVDFDSRLLRPTEVDHLVGDPSKAKEKLNWTSEVSGSELAELMVREDLMQLTNPSHVDRVDWKRIFGDV